MSKERDDSSEADKANGEALTIYRNLASNNLKAYAGKVESLTKRLAAVSVTPSPTKP
jgi:hypothetical protein